MSTERRGVYALTYVASVGLWGGLLYVILRTWLGLSYPVVYTVVAAFVALLTAGFVIVFFTAALPTAGQRLIARQKCGFWLVLIVGLFVAAAFAWLSRGPGWRGWLVSGLVFLTTAAVGAIASWLGYRLNLKLFVRRARSDRRK